MLQLPLTCFLLLRSTIVFLCLRRFLIPLSLRCFICISHVSMLWYVFLFLLSGINGAFVAQACWINCLYVYKDIRYHANDVGYYGIPRDINNDGMYEDGTVCATTDSSHRRNENCRPMEKTFYLQYQYMTFVLAALAVFYYAPYAIFRYINTDVVSLKGSIESK